MNKRTKVIVFILVLMCSMTVLLPKSHAENVGVIQNRTIEDIVNKYKEKPFRLARSSKTVDYDVKPSSSSPYVAGKVKDEYLKEALDGLNFIRYLVGLPDDIYLDQTYIDYTQHGAVLLAAIDELTHGPYKPADMSNEFYDIAYKGPSQSNCGKGYSNILDTLFGYMHDSDPSNIDRLGHRRWLLNPPMQKTGFGYYDRYSDTYVFDRSRESEILYDFISWPARNYMPVDLMRKDIAWSVNLGTAYDDPSIDNVKVTLTRRNDGKTWTFSQNEYSNNTGTGYYFNVNNGGYGMSKCIIFRPDIDGYTQNDIFDVTISGISQGGSSTEIKYMVQMFNLLKPEPVKADKQDGTYQNILTVALSCDTSDVDIYYTMDGSTPTTESYWYSRPINITETTVIKAIACINGIQSEVSTFHYTIEKEKVEQNIIGQGKIGKDNTGQDKTGQDKTGQFNIILDKIELDKIAQASQWAVLDIVKAISLKLIPSQMQTNYVENISRADFCKLVLNLLVQKMGKSVEELLNENHVSIKYNTFTDTSDKEILAANALGIVNGVGNGRFNPNGMITRQEAAVMLMRTAAVLGITKTNEQPEVFTDKDTHAIWAREAIAFVSSLKDKTSNNKIMGGVGNGKFDPLGGYTREQSFVTMLRLFNAL